MTRVVVLMQENKTPDYYFPTLAAWGADVRNGGTLLTDPPIQDPQHDRNAWVHYKMGDYAPPDVQINNDVVLPLYSWLAKTFTFCDHHFGLGTNSTRDTCLQSVVRHRLCVILRKAQIRNGTFRRFSNTSRSGG